MILRFPHPPALVRGMGLALGPTLLLALLLVLGLALGMACALPAPALAASSEHGGGEAKTGEASGGHGAKGEEKSKPGLSYGGTIKPEELKLTLEEKAVLERQPRDYAENFPSITVLLQRLEDVPPKTMPRGGPVTPETIIVAGLMLETPEGVKIWPNRIRVPRRVLVARVVEMLDKAAADYAKLKENPGFKNGNVKRIYF